MTGDGALSLGKAITKLRPDLTQQSIEVEVKKAEAAAKKAEAEAKKQTHQLVHPETEKSPAQNVGLFI